jgi:hypothetical protein
MFCALILVFGGSEGVESRFHVLRSRTHFGQYRWRRVSFSYFALPDSFGNVLRASGHVLKFYALGIILCSTEGTGPHFHVLRS